eukprot:scaffold461_cov321-Pavlova_lutheri.AAC.36
MCELVGRDEGEQGDGFAGPGGHFQQSMSLFVPVLFRHVHVSRHFRRSCGWVRRSVPSVGRTLASSACFSSSM